MRLGMRESEAPVDRPMDVDEDGHAPDTPGEGRAHSVVSTRSGRSRKQVSLSGQPSALTDVLHRRGPQMIGDRCPCLLLTRRQRRQPVRVLRDRSSVESM
jgi:hypothetical protein